MNRTIYLDEIAAEKWDCIKNKSRWVQERLNQNFTYTRKVLDYLSNMPFDIEKDDPVMGIIISQAQLAKDEIPKE